MTFDHGANFAVEEAIGEGDEETLEWEENIPENKKYFKFNPIETLEKPMLINITPRYFIKG